MEMNKYLCMLLMLTVVFVSSCGGGGGGGDDTVMLGGHIERMDGVPVPNVSVSIVDTITNNTGNGPLIIQTDSNGDFEREWGTSGVGTQQILIIPSHPNFSFSPSQYSFTLDADRVDLIFVADPI
jgi:hypothetical protein